MLCIYYTFLIVLTVNDCVVCVEKIHQTFLNIFLTIGQLFPIKRFFFILESNAI